MDTDKIYRKIKETLSRLENEKFTGQIKFKLMLNQGGIRQSMVERTEKLEQN